MRTIDQFLKVVSTLALLLVGTIPVVAEAVAWKARDLRWNELAAVKGASTAALWSDATGNGHLHRLPINQPLVGVAESGDGRILILRGALSFEVAGRPLGDFGPGSFMSIPRGANYTLTASAAGECTFLLVHATAAGVTDPLASKAREISWSPLPTIKGAGTARLWHDATGNGVLHRLPINQPLTEESGAGEGRILVMLGALSVEIDGRPLGEFGPGSFVSARRGATYTMTATAAGECTFLLIRAEAAN